jgi:hypothetical protein
MPYPQDTNKYKAPRDPRILKSKSKSFPSVVVIVRFPKQQSAGGIRKVELRTLGRFIGRWPNLVVVEGKIVSELAARNVSIWSNLMEVDNRPRSQFGNVTPS